MSHKIVIKFTVTEISNLKTILCKMSSETWASGTIREEASDLFRKVCDEINSQTKDNSWGD